MPTSRLPRVDDGHAVVGEVAVAGDDRGATLQDDAGDHHVLSGRGPALPPSFRPQRGAALGGLLVEGQDAPGEAAGDELPESRFQGTLARPFGQEGDARADLE